LFSGFQASHKNSFMLRMPLLKSVGEMHRVQLASPEILQGIPLIKRFSGGGTVVVDHNCHVVSFVVNQTALPNVKMFPRNIMQWTELFYRSARLLCVGSVDHICVMQTHLSTARLFT